jgi:hypothetical protein
MSNQYNKYNNSKIYKIWSPQTEFIYIGSTYQMLCKRLADHKSFYKMNTGTIKCSSFEIIKYDDVKIELIENLSCNNKEELTKREGEIIRQYKDICINMRIEGRTRKEYYEDNKDKRKEYYDDNKEQILKNQKKYYDEHKEQIIERQKKYYKNNKEQEIERSKRYYEEHKEQILQKDKKYREKHKQEIVEKQSKQYNCICGSTIRWSDKSRHFHTLKHHSYLEDSMFHLLDL